MIGAPILISDEDRLAGDVEDLLRGHVWRRTGGCAAHIGMRMISW